jgi:hypothetical protein
VAVIKACHCDPALNRSYANVHAITAAVLLARTKDKAKVEACVGLVERGVLSRLRNGTFYSQAELNAAIAERLCKSQRAARAPPVRTWCEMLL